MNQKTYCKYCNRETYSVPNGELITCLECGQIKYSETRKRKANIEKLSEELQDRAKQQLSPIPKCPKCGSTAIATVNKGFGLFRGFIGSGKPVNVCQNCGHKWEPGK